MDTQSLPYEIHITVTPSVAEQTSDVEHFKGVCTSLNVKPIILDLELQSGKIQKDVMTSSKHHGTDETVFQEVERIAKGLEEHNYQVVRKKIETVPWHPRSPKKKDGVVQMPPGCYFEAHIPVIVLPFHIPVLRDCASILSEDPRYKIHISSNVFSKQIDGTVTIMLTYRTATECQEDFEYYVMYISQRISVDSSPWKVEKVIKEFSIYDTNISHDANWLKK